MVHGQGGGVAEGLAGRCGNTFGVTWQQSGEPCGAWRRQQEEAEAEQANSRPKAFLEHCLLFDGPLNAEGAAQRGGRRGGERNFCTALWQRVSHGE